MRRQWLIHVTLWQHLIWAALLIGWPGEVARLTTVKAPVDLFGGTLTTALIYSTVSLALIVIMLAGDAAMESRRFWGLCLAACVAQQFLLMVSATGSVWAIAQGRSLAGFVAPRARLTAGQEIYILLAVFHPFAVLDVFAPGVMRRVWEKLHWSRKSRPG